MVKMEKIELIFDKQIFNNLTRDEMAKAIQMLDIMKDTFKKPTEIWRRENKRFYLKAYKDIGSIMVIVVDNFFSEMYKISNEEADANRFGELIYKNN